MNALGRWVIGSAASLFLAASAVAAPAGPPTDLHGDPLPPGAVARIGTVRFAGRDRAYNAIAFSPDGKLFAGVLQRGEIDLWDYKAGKLLRSFGPPESKPTPDEILDVTTNWPYCGPQVFIFFGPDNKTLLTASDHWPIRLWDVTTGKELAKMNGSEGGVGVLAVSLDFKTVAAGRKTERHHWPDLTVDRGLSLWEVSSGKVLRRWEAGAKVCALAWSPDGKTLASGEDDQWTQFWDPQSGKLTGSLGGSDAAVVGVAYSPDGKTLATADLARRLALWDLTGDQKAIRSWAVGGRLPKFAAGAAPTIGAIFFTPDGKGLLTCDTLGLSSINRWEVASGKRLWQIDANGCCAASADGTTLATGDPPGYFYDLDTGKLLPQAVTPGWRVEHLQYLPDGKTLVTNHKDLWDAATGRKLDSLDVRLPTAISPDGKHFVVWGQEAFSYRDLATGKEVRKLLTKTRDTSFPREFSADGGTLAVLEHEPLSPNPLQQQRNKAVRFWDLTTGAENKPLSLSACPRSLWQISLSPDGRLVAGLGYAPTDKCKGIFEDEAGATGPCYLLDRGTGRLLHTLDLGTVPPTTVYHRDLLFTPDGRGLVTYGDNGCDVWEVQTGKRKLRVTEQGVSAAACSPDGRLVAWCADEGEDGHYAIRLTDLATGKERARLAGHIRQVSALAFSPDGKRLASGASDASALVWDLTALPARPK